MAEPNKVDIEFNAKTERASSDVKKMQRDIEATGASGKKAAASITGSFNAVQRAIGGVRRALGTLTFATVLIDSLVNIVRKFNEWRTAAEKAADKTRELQKAAADKSAAEGVRKVAEAYRELTREMSAASAERARQNELFNEKLSVQREAEDAELDAQEAEELAAVDPNDENADRSRAEIQRRYALRRARTTANRKAVDRINRSDDYARQAAELTSAADRMEESLAGDDSNISRARLRAGTLERLAGERNEKDGTWYAPRKRTAEGDEVRENQRKEAESLREQVRKLEADRAEKERQIADLRARAAHAGEMSAALGASAATPELQSQTAAVRSETAEASDRASWAAADRRKADADRRKEEEEAKRASALAAQAALPQQIAQVQAQIADAQGRKDAAALGVYNAQNAYDLARVGGDRGGQVSAYGSLQAAQTNANDVNAAADKVLFSLNETLKDLKRRLDAANNYLKRDEYAWAEAPAGG